MSGLGFSQVKSYFHSSRMTANLSSTEQESWIQVFYRLPLPIIDIHGQADEPQAHDAVGHGPADVVLLGSFRVVA